jgi:hypothetical protein
MENGGNGSIATWVRSRAFGFDLFFLLQMKGFERIDDALDLNVPFAIERCAPRFEHPSGQTLSAPTCSPRTSSATRRRREPRTHSFRHQGVLRRFQRDPTPRSGRPAIKKARDMFQSKRIDEFGAGRAA